MIESGILTKIISAYQIAEATHGEFVECKHHGHTIISEEVGEFAKALQDEPIANQEAELIDIIVACCRFHEKHY